ncbi:MAG: hypothetical protein RLZZ373_3811 [Pseudomonadota bacterium]
MAALVRLAACQRGRLLALVPRPYRQVKADQPRMLAGHICRAVRQRGNMGRYVSAVLPLCLPRGPQLAELGAMLAVVRPWFDMGAGRHLLPLLPLVGERLPWVLSVLLLLAALVLQWLA